MTNLVTIVVTKARKRTIIFDITFQCTLWYRPLVSLDHTLNTFLMLNGVSRISEELLCYTVVVLATGVTAADATWHFDSPSTLQF